MSGLLSWDNDGMHSIPPARPDLQEAVRDANAAIRAIVSQWPGGRLPPAGERDDYDKAVTEYVAAVRARDGARAREGNTKGEPARAA